MAENDKFQDVSNFTFGAAFGAEFGLEVQSFFRSRIAAFEGLSAGDWRRRCAALETLIKHWNIERELMGQLCVELLADRHEQVRAVAIRSLGTLFFGTKSKPLLQLLAALALDESKANRERRAAYDAVLRIQCSEEQLQELANSGDWQAEERRLNAQLEGIVNDSVPEMNMQLLRELAVE